MELEMHKNGVDSYIQIIRIDIVQPAAIKRICPQDRQMQTQAPFSSKMDLNMLDLDIQTNNGNA